MAQFEVVLHYSDKPKRIQGGNGANYTSNDPRKNPTSFGKAISTLRVP